MKKVVIIVLFLSFCSVFAIRQQNVVVATSPSYFRTLLNCTKFHDDSLVVVLCYVSNHTKFGQTCSTLRCGCHKKNGKSFWLDTHTQMRKTLRSVARMNPEVLFVELDVSIPGMERLMKELNVSVCQPEYLLFKGGKAVADGRKAVDLCRMTESSLHYFVSKFFGDDLPVCDCKKVVLVHDFAKEPYQGYSLWDWGYTFYPNSLWPYSGPYYPMFVGAVE
jgi:hypothetical protein